jgi:hypothetical protein
MGNRLPGKVIETRNLLTGNDMFLLFVFLLAEGTMDSAEYTRRLGLIFLEYIRAEETNTTSKGKQRVAFTTNEGAPRRWSNPLSTGVTFL